MEKTTAHHNGRSRTFDFLPFDLNDTREKLSDFGDQATDFIRSKPALALLGAFCVGFALKSAREPPMNAESSVSEAADHLRTTALQSVQRLAHELDGGFGELRNAVQNEVRSNPIRSVLIAAGVGYLLGGGLAAPLTRRLARLALRAMLLPALEEPTARLWDWIRSDYRRSRPQGIAAIKPE